MNLTDKMKPAWLNDNSPYDGYSHLDPLENRFFKDQVEREAFMKNSQYSTQNDSRYSAINYSIIDDEDDVRYNKYEINWFFIEYNPNKISHSDQFLAHLQSGHISP